MDDLRTFILDQLIEHTNLAYKVKGYNIYISCPFHVKNTGKEDIHPSLGVYLGGNPQKSDKAIGMFGCYSCTAHGHWNKLAEELGVEQIDDDYWEKNPFASLEMDLNEIAASGRQVYKQPKDLHPWEGIWGRTEKFKGFPEEFMKTLPTFRMFDAKFETFRAFWPITTDNESIGHITARLDGNTEGPKYLNSPGAWAKKALFLYDMPIKKGVVLVEGPRDAIRLRYEQIPAMAILGTNCWHPYKMTLLAKKGIERVVLCMDGDSSGYEATEEIYRQIKTSFDVRIIELPFREEKERQLDPGNMPEKYLKRVRLALK